MTTSNNATNHFQFESQETAASYARFLMSTEVKCNFATQHYQKPNYSYSSVEDFSESYNKNGIPIFLLADISTTSKNLLKNPIGSISINTNNCSVKDCGNMPYDNLACSRMTLMGEFKQIKNYEKNDPNILTFIEKHPAASYWLNDKNHAYNLWTFEIHQIYYIGGYGHLHYIGNIDLNLYFNTNPAVPPK